MLIVLDWKEKKDNQGGVVGGDERVVKMLSTIIFDWLECDEINKNHWVVWEIIETLTNKNDHQSYST